jgi:hypothetical protein
VANPCDWSAIDRFESLAHYQEFLAALSTQVADGRVKVLPVDPAKGWGSAWDEHWYQCLASNETWRLVSPEPPFRGIFKKLEPA